MQCTYRILTESDLQAFRHLRLTSLRDSPSAFDESPEQEERYTSHDWRKKITSEGRWVIGAFDSSTLVGISTQIRDLRQKLSHKVLISGVFVTPSHRRKKIGTTLLKEAIYDARSRDGVSQIWLTVNTQNHVAKKIYLSLGFKQFGIEPNHMLLSTGPQHEIYMSLATK